MAAYPVNKERINYSRLCRGIVDLCTDVLRDILHRRVNPNNLMRTFTKCADFSRLKAQDRTCIRNSGGAGSYKNFDITVLYQVMRTLFTQDLRDSLKTNIDPSQINTAVQNCSALSSCLTSNDLNSLNHSVTTNSYDNLKDKLLWTLYIQFCRQITNFVHPTKSWSDNPDPAAITLGDDIERIGILRNTAYGHISTTEINDVDFRKHWTTLNDVIIQMEIYLCSGYKKLLDDIEVSRLDMEAEKKIIDQMRKLGENISDLDTSVKILERKHKGMTVDVTGLKAKVAEVTKTQNTMARKDPVPDPAPDPVPKLLRGNRRV